MQNIWNETWAEFLSSGALLGHQNHSLIIGVGLKLQMKHTGQEASSGQKTQEGLAADGAFWAMDFFDSAQIKKIIPQKIFILTLKEFLEQLEAYGEKQKWKLNTQLNTQWKNYTEPEKKDFFHDFEVIQEAIDKKEIEKAVPITRARFSYTFDHQGIWSSLIRLLKKLHTQDTGKSLCRKLIPYGYWHKNEGLLGATPELLLQTQGDGCFKTMALAGTAAKSVDDAVFLQDPKELKEHHYVVDFLKERIKQLDECAQVKVGETRVCSFSNIKHLYTELEFFLKDKDQDKDKDQQFDLGGLIKHFHPTPALGVSSKNWDWQWLKRLSYQKERKEFGAPFVFLGPKGSMTAVVGIRNIMWKENRGLLTSGCGIIKESEKEKEWQELFIKRESVKKLFF